MSERVEFAEQRASIRGEPVQANQRVDLFMEPIDAGVLVLPAIGQRLGVEGLDQIADFLELEQSRARGHEQSDRELNRRDVIDEIQRGNRVHEIAVSVEREPGMKRNERRDDCEPRGAAQGNGLEKIRPRVSLLENRKDSIVQGLNRGRHERAARRSERRQQMTLLQEMFDLDGHVIGDLGVRGVESGHDPERVGWTVEEVGVAKGDMARARSDLGRDVGGDDFGLHQPELSVVDRDDGQCRHRCRHPLLASVYPTRRYGGHRPSRAWRSVPAAADPFDQAPGTAGAERRRTRTAGGFCFYWRAAP